MLSNAPVRHPLLPESVIGGSAARPKARAARAPTLTRLIQATEDAAQKILDEAERCAAARDRLCAALVRLQSVDAEAVPPVEPAITTIQAQEPTEDHLRAGIAAVEEIQERLAAVLRLVSASVENGSAGSANGYGPITDCPGSRLVDPRGGGPAHHSSGAPPPIS